MLPANANTDCFSSYTLCGFKVCYISFYLAASIFHSNSSFRFPHRCRTLSSSDDVQDRETEKGRLEEAFETCDRDLDELIVQHYAELTTAIRTYQSITERITSSRNKIKQVKKKRGDKYARTKGVKKAVNLDPFFCFYLSLGQNFILQGLPL